MNKAPLFILAPPRSFTSVICGMVGQHPEMCGLPEVNLFVADDYDGLGRLYRMRPGFRHGLLRAIAELGLGEQTDENVTVARKWLEEHHSESTAELYKDLVEWASPKRLVDKSPIYVYAPETLQRILDAFPDAYFIHLTRHPRATCESIIKLRGVVSEGLDKMRVGERAREMIKSRHDRIAQVEDPDSMWLKPHLRIMEFLENVPAEQQMRIKGEDYMSDPPAYLRKIAEWLGVSSSEDAIDAMMHPERSPFACYGPPGAKYGNDPSYLENPAFREYKPRQDSLEGAMEWDPDVSFSEDLMQCAMFFEYT